MFGYASQTGYSNTFVGFRRTIQEHFNKGEDTEALGRLKAINPLTWLPYIDSFNVVSTMVEDGAYEPGEIVEWWLGDTSFDACLPSAS